MLTLFRNLLFIFLLPLTAHAEWVVHEGGVKIAVLLDIEEGDEKLPAAERYIISSPGGNFGTTQLVAAALQGKPVFYDFALSGGAFIANATNAIPIMADSVKGYHWSRYDGDKDPKLNNDIKMLLILIDQEILKNIINKYQPRFAARIIGMMDGLKETEFVIDVASEPDPKVLDEAKFRNLAAFKRYKAIINDQ